MHHEGSKSITQVILAEPHLLNRGKLNDYGVNKVKVACSRKIKMDDIHILTRLKMMPSWKTDLRPPIIYKIDIQASLAFPPPRLDS